MVTFCQVELGLKNSFIPNRETTRLQLGYYGDVCGRRLRCSSTCRELIVGLLATERSLLPVRRSGTVCRTTSLTVHHWPRSADLFCLLYHFHDYIFLFSGP